MDPADADPIVRAISNQGAILGQHDQLLKNLMDNQTTTNDQIAQLNAMLRELSIKLTQPVPSPTLDQQQAPPPPPHVSAQHTREAHIPDPENYRGEMGKCGGFLLQCSLVFSQKPVTYAADSSKVAFVMGLLQGKALDWATAMWQSHTDIHNDYVKFESELKKVFDHPVQGKEASKRLLCLNQGSHSVAEYSVEFRTLAAEAGWDDSALQTVFLNGLSEQLKDELALKDDSENLDTLISTAIKIDNRLRERRRERNNRSSTSSRPPVPRNPSSFVPPNPPIQTSSLLAQGISDEPMQLGRAKLTPAERFRRINAGECLYCGQLGHFLSTCPSRPKERAHQ